MKRPKFLKSGPVHNFLTYLTGQPKLATVIWPPLADYRAIVYFGDATTGAEHIFRQWVDIFEGSGIPYFSVFRHKSMYLQARRDRPDAPIAFAMGGDDIATLINHVPNLRVVFHTGNPGNISQIMQYRHFKQVFIGHGDSDKATSASRMFRLYDEIWVAGQAHADRLKGILPPDTTVEIVGRPQVAAALRDNASSVTTTRPSFAFLPTWEGSREEINYTSAPMTEDLALCVENIGYMLRAKFHPSTGHRLKKLKSIEKDLSGKAAFAMGRCEIVERKISAADVMAEADFCITDVSSIISDWIVRDRPIFVYMPDNIVTSKSKFPIDSYCYTFKTAEEFHCEILRVVVEGDDYKADQRAKAADYLVSRDATMSGAFEARARLLCEMS